MTKAPSRHLKVFAAQFGFYDTVVAAPSQAAALEAWGTHQNLFASGQARLAEDAQAVDAALANPGLTLKRAAGSNAPFALEPTSLPSVPDAPMRERARAAPKPTAPPKPVADRSKLDAAEAALGKLDEKRKRQEAEFRRRREDLEVEQAAAQAAYVDARKAYDEAGGDG